MEVNVDGTSLVIQSWKLLFDAQFSCGTFALNCEAVDSASGAGWGT